MSVQLPWRHRCRWVVLPALDHPVAVHVLKEDEAGCVVSASDEDRAELRPFGWDGLAHRIGRHWVFDTRAEAEAAVAVHILAAEHRGPKLTNIRDRVHQPFWDALVKTASLGGI